MLETARQVLRHRSLLFTLVSRELKARYRGSLLGFLWSLVTPLMLLGVYSFVFGTVFNPPRAQAADPYAVFLITGLFPWIWASTSLLEGTMSLISNAGLLRKAVFPAVILPLVSILTNLVHFVFALPVVAGALVVGRLLGHPVGGWGFLLLPFVVALQLPLVAGITVALAALNVHFKDTRDILSNLLQLVFFLTPILYPLAWVTVPALAAVVRWANPFSPFTLAYQATLFHGSLPEPLLWVQMASWAVVSWSAGSWLFRRLSLSLVEAV